MSVCVKPSVTMPAKRAPHTVDDGALRVAGLVFPAPGEGASRPSSGAAYSVLTVALPDSALLLLRLIGAHDGVEDEGAIITRLVVARAEQIGIAALADASQCGGYPESEEGREGVPSGAFPLPQGPP